MSAAVSLPPEPTDYDGVVWRLQAAEDELRWRFESAGAAVGFHAQPYDFDRPKGGSAPGGEVAICKGVKVMTFDADFVRAFASRGQALKAASIDATLAAMSREDQEILVEAYAPRGTSKLLQSKLVPLVNRRSMVGIAHRSSVAKAAHARHLRALREGRAEHEAETVEADAKRDSTLPAEDLRFVRADRRSRRALEQTMHREPSIAEFLSEAAGPNAKDDLFKAIREQCARMLDPVLGRYDVLRRERVRAAKSDEKRRVEEWADRELGIIGGGR